MDKTINQKAWFLVLPVFLVVAFSAILPLMTVVNYSMQDTFGNIFNAGADFSRDGSQFDHLFHDGEVFPRRMVRSTRTRSDSTTVVGTGSGASAQRRTSCLKRRSKRTARWQCSHSSRWASSSSQVVGGASWSR